MLRLRSVLAIAATLSMVAACSGATSSDLFAHGGDDNGLSGEAAPADGGTTSDAAPPTSSGNPPPTEPGQPPPKPGGDTSDAGANCQAESEPNDTADSADPFTSSFCGKVGTETDMDFAKIVAPATATTLTVHHTESASVDYRIYQNGALFTPALSTSGIYPVIGGATYTFRMMLPQGSGNRPTYRLDVTFQ